jgi:hypothetical protein
VATSLALLVFAASPSFSANGNIGIFADQGQALCELDLGFQTQTTLYVYALLQGSSGGGIQGAEYSISQSASVDWIISEDYSPSTNNGAITVGGGALTGLIPGINLGWPACQVGPGSVLLQTISLFDATGTDAGTPVTLRVEAHQTPGNPFFRCPLFNLCDDPVFTKVCLGSNLTTVTCPFPPGAFACTTSSSGELIINPEEGQSCTVAVQQKTWSEMKSLYN